MKRIFYLFILLSNLVYSQNSFKAVIRDSKTNEELIGASVVFQGTTNGVNSDSKGLVEIRNIPDGKQIFVFSYIGYETKKDTFNFPLSSSNPIIILLTPSSEVLNEIIVSSTRTSRSVENNPTRVEVIASDELEEEAHMKPNEIKKLLTEGTGITTQQTAATSGIFNIRIHGLEGRYTQLLRDGMPLYSGFSGGLSIMEITPLDLGQIEFIKGSASTLYGGGAIAGLVNLISKTPQEKEELSVLLNGTSAKGFDGSVFYAQKWEKFGTTFFGSYNYNLPYDPAHIGFTAIPQTNCYTINPKIFFYFSKKTTAWFGLNATYEDRYGGDIKVIEGKSDSIHKYFERNKVLRMSSQLSVEHQLNSESKISIKNSVGYFDRQLLHPNSNFSGQQVSSFSEINYSLSHKKSDWIAGINWLTDNFSSVNVAALNYKVNTTGIFAQNSFRASEKISFETGLRIDHNLLETTEKVKDLFVLPRVNVLFTINKHITSRIGGGFGYKMPTPFSEEADAEGYQNIQPISLSSVKPEKSYGLNGDITYRTSIEEVIFSVSQLFFYTYLSKPLLLLNNNYTNANGFIDTKGGETNIKINIDDLNLYIGYTYSDTRQHFDGNNLWQPLTAKHRLLTDFLYENGNNYITGVECNYVSPQKLSNGNTGKGYVIFGLMFEKIWKYFNTYINIENLTDVRQTHWEKIYTGTITDPVFGEIYAPLDGIVINVGVKIKL